MKKNGISKTAYEWCIENEIRVTGLENYQIMELAFYTAYVSDEEFKNTLHQFKTEKEFKKLVIKEGKLHLKSEKYLELRMYSLVPYNLLGIQMGIQHEHSVVQNFVENMIKPIQDVGVMDPKLVRWATEWKTSILLNGGTSNEGHKVRHGFKDVWYVGTMQQNLAKLVEADIDVSAFYEPDLNSMLTGVSFIVDERVFNRKLYKDFVPTLKEQFYDMTAWDGDMTELDKYNGENYQHWVKKIGGEKNAFLRTFLKGFRLAQG
jgi:hypothetical protein